MLISLFLFLISFVPSSVANANDNFKHTICSKTTNPSACLNLKHVQTSSNPKGLTTASIEVALSKATDIHAKLNSLYNEKDGHLGDIYLHCSKNYNDAIRDLTIAKRSLDTRHSKSAAIEAYDAEEEVKACQVVFNDARRDPDDIKKANEEFYFLTQIARASTEELVKNNRK
ncbi:hypothetical protein ACH5RR_015808 [Cinchona calisaya]|uniref:Pectinesterase inhibitor domain-containing protein n=1 Tax=Cinchona calisaya TaxID=153742 RepID=A0ABD2ZU80_9GENT